MTSLRRFADPGYPALFRDLSGLLEAARHSYARTVNAIMTATYWEIGRRIVEFEQRGEKRAEYGVALLESLAVDLMIWQDRRGDVSRNLKDSQEGP